MIRSFRSKALRRYWEKGDASRLPPAQVPRLTRMLRALETATRPEDVAAPGYRFHELKGDRVGTYSISVTGNWRITFQFDGEDAVNIDHEDYH